MSRDNIVCSECGTEDTAEVLVFFKQLSLDVPEIVDLIQSYNIDEEILYILQFNRKIVESIDTYRSVLKSYLEELPSIDILMPMGRFATEIVFGDTYDLIDIIGRSLSKTYDGQTYDVVPSFHPAAFKSAVPTTKNQLKLSLYRLQEKL